MQSFEKILLYEKRKIMYNRNVELLIADANASEEGW